MRRGLITWNRDEEPEQIFDDRVARLQAAMGTEKLDAVLIYTNFARPAAVSFLTHFVPYWSQGVLLVRPKDLPILLISLSKRVQGWINETAHVAEIISTPRLGNEIAAHIAQLGARRVGVVERDKMPAPLLSALGGNHPHVQLTDASEVFAKIRHPADESEIALSTKAARIVQKALGEAGFGKRAPAQALGHAERAARLAGAEEILIDVCEDLTRTAGFRRAQGAVEFGPRFAVRLSVAYRGYWVRVGQSFNGDGNAPHPARSIASLIKKLTPGPAPSTNAEHMFEGCCGTLPLAPLRHTFPGSVISLTHMSNHDGPCCVSMPIYLPEDGSPARPLLA